MNKLTAERLRTLLHYNQETGLFTWIAGRGLHNANRKAGTPHSKGYWRISVDNKTYFAHRLAWLYVFGTWPDGQIDHINQCKTDNRMANLRIATNSLNHANMPGWSVVGMKGVCADKGKWKAQIMRDGRKQHLGSFATPEEAHAVYCQAAMKADGEYVFTGHKTSRHCRKQE